MSKRYAPRRETIWFGVAITSITVGKMPGRQVIIYDKRREVIDRHKPIWWDIWNANLAREDFAPLDPTNRDTSRIWRIEIRAGKDLLKDRWQIRRWAEFDAKFGDVVAEALQKIHYCTPDPQDTNRARWPNHPLWDLISAETGGDLAEMRSHLPPSQIKHVHRTEHIRLIMAQLTGNAITLAALEGTSEAKLADHMAPEWAGACATPSRPILHALRTSWIRRGIGIDSLSDGGDDQGEVWAKDGCIGVHR